VHFMDFTEYWPMYQTKKGLANLNKTLLREHYMKMKKLLSESITLLKYRHPPEA
jgi:hypothetical protein